jgi:hypothetical protein
MEKAGHWGLHHVVEGLGKGLNAGEGWMASWVREYKQCILQQCWLRLKAEQIYEIIACAHLIGLRLIS